MTICFCNCLLIELSKQHLQSLEAKFNALQGAEKGWGEVKSCFPLVRFGRRLQNDAAQLAALVSLERNIDLPPYHQYGFPALCIDCPCIIHSVGSGSLLSAIRLLCAGRRRLDREREGAEGACELSSPLRARRHPYTSHGRLCIMSGP